MVTENLPFGTILKGEVVVLWKESIVYFDLRKSQTQCLSQRKETVFSFQKAMIVTAGSGHNN